MGVPSKFIAYQAPVIATLGRTAFGALYRQATGHKPPPSPVPSPETIAVLPPRPKDLVRCYVRHVGGDPSAYRGKLPPHLFPQWGFPLAGEAFSKLDYPLQNILNAGCRMEIRAPLPDSEPLHVRARLQSVDDNGRRALLQTRVVTGTASSPEALIGDIFALVPLGRGKGAKKEKKEEKEPVRVPLDAQELAYWRIGPSAGLEFAKLTGDFNPLHWVKPYARAFGFRSTILHGFSTMARAVEGVVQGLLSGAADAVELVDVKFTRPLLLPAKVGLYLTDEQKIYVGDGPGARAYLEGEIRLRPDA